MSQHNEKTIKQAIDETLNTFNLKSKVAETRIISSWEKIVGKMIANHTRKIFISKGALFIYLDNPALKNELKYSRDKIIELLNESAGEDLIKDVIIK